MGENILKGQVKSFKKGTDRSLQEMAKPMLFDRPDLISTIYTAAPTEGQAVAEGDHLEAHASADGQCIHLAKGHVCVARIEGDGAKALLDALREPGSPGVISMNITTVSEVSGYMKAVIVGKNGAQ
jgi:hypothetical protein